MYPTTKQSGFTIIEMLVSLALFTIVATVATGALLSLIGGNTRLVEEQTVMTSLSFALDSMTRELRTGSEYYCGTVTQVANSPVNSSLTAIQDCPLGDLGISFREGGQSLTGGGSKRIAFYHDADAGTIMRRVGASTPAPLVAGEVDITGLRFFVEGTTPLMLGGLAVNSSQPTVTIVITARAKGGELDKNFSIQSTVTQRALDI